MPNFYVAQQNTFNGDGTTPDAATFDGGVGASNDFINAAALTPAYGSIVEDDTLHVRAYGSDPRLLEWDVTASARVLIKVKKTIVDIHGAIWMDSTGYFVIGTPHASYGLQLTVSYSYARGLAQSTDSINSYAGQDFLIVNNAVMEDYYMYSAATGITTNTHCNVGLSGIRNLFIRAVFDIGRASTYKLFFDPPRGARLIFKGCTLDITRTAAGYFRLFGSGTEYGSPVFECKGLKILGAHLLNDFMSISSTSKVIAADYVMEELHVDYDFARQVPENSWQGKELHIGGYDGKFGFRHESPQHIAVWRAGQNFPTLNALLPDGVTPWSVRVLPATILSADAVATLTSMKKRVPTPDSVQSVTTELTIKDVYTNPLDDEWWATVTYTDTTGAIRVEDTKGVGAPLTASTAQWNPLSLGIVAYGPNTYYRYKLVLVTEHPVKQDTLLTVAVSSTRPSTTSNDFYFVCPDITLVTV